MAGSPAKFCPIQARWGTVLQSSTRKGSASYDGAGKRFIFVSSSHLRAKFALDVELKSELLSNGLRNVLDVDPIESWTKIEVVAKLLNLPAHSVLKSWPDIGVNTGITFDTIVTTEHVITIGKLEAIDQSGKDQP